MGYYTRYRLKIKEKDSDFFESVESHEIVRAYIEAGSITTNSGDNYLEYALLDEETCKWYDHEKDMKEMSSTFPDYLFKLSGEGEEAGDLWIKYFKNGKVQVCEAKITYDEYDESKLK